MGPPGPPRPQTNYRPIVRRTNTIREDSDTKAPGIALEAVCDKASNFYAIYLSTQKNQRCQFDPEDLRGGHFNLGKSIARSDDLAEMYPTAAFHMEKRIEDTVNKREVVKIGAEARKAMAKKEDDLVEEWKRTKDAAILGPIWGCRLSLYNAMRVEVFERFNGRFKSLGKGVWRYDGVRAQLVGSTWEDSLDLPYVEGSSMASGEYHIEVVSEKKLEVNQEGGERLAVKVEDLRIGGRDDKEGPWETV